MGAVLADVLAFNNLEYFDFRGAGLHGGGDIAAFLLVGFFVVCSIIGAIFGGLISGLIALMIVLIKLRGRKPG